MDDSTELVNVWNRAQSRFDDPSIRPQQKAWIALTRPLGLVEDTALLAAPNDFAKDYLENRLRPLIAAVLSEELGRDIQCRRHRADRRGARRRRRGRDGTAGAGRSP